MNLDKIINKQSSFGCCLGSFEEYSLKSPHRSGTGKLFKMAAKVDRHSLWLIHSNFVNNDSIDFRVTPFDSWVNFLQLLLETFFYKMLRFLVICSRTGRIFFLKTSGAIFNDIRLEYEKFGLYKPSRENNADSNETNLMFLREILAELWRKMSK